MRVAGFALVVVLAGMFLWWMSGPAASVRVPRAPALGAPAEGAPRGGTGFTLGGGGLSGLARRNSGRSSASEGSSFPVRAQEPAIFTAVPGDGPISEAGPGSVTELYPPPRVTYITTSEAPPETPEAPSTRISSIREAGAAPQPGRDQPRGPRRVLDAAIEGGLGTDGRSDDRDVPGQIR